MTSPPGDDERAPDGDPPPFPDFAVESSERIYDSVWCGLRRDWLRLPDGERQEYHVVEIPDAIAVVPVLADGRLLLIWQHRHPSGRSQWEVPAGRIHTDERPQAAAVRELREETGHAPARMESLGGFFPITGISDHYCHVFLAHGCTAVGAQELERGERIVTRAFAQHEVLAMLRADAIQDGFAALSLGRFFLARARGDSGATAGG